MIFKIWHGLLGMKKYDSAWHEADIEEELMEYQKAEGFWEKWSESSDIVYTYTRAKWSGHANLLFPLTRRQFLSGSIYMFPKYTLRWLFFVAAGKLAGSRGIIREVRNPQKLTKLDEIAKKNSLDKEKFRLACQKLLRYWILLK